MSAAAATAPDMSKERFHLLGGGVRAELDEPDVGHGEFSRVGGRLPGRLWAGGGLTCAENRILSSSQASVYNVEHKTFFWHHGTPLV